MPTSASVLLPALPRRSPLRLLQVEKQDARHEWTIYPKSNDRFGIKGLVSPGEGAKMGRLYDGKSGLVVLAEDESGPIPS